MACYDDSFTKVRKIKYDRFVFWSSKQGKGESVESFYGHLIEQAENCSLGDEETTLIRDTFILNMLDHDTQKQLLKETVLHTKALEVAKQMEMEAQNQQKINQNLNIATNSVNAVNNSQNRNRNSNYQKLVRTSLGTHPYPKTISTLAFAPIVANDGANHRQICPAIGNKCNECGITGHFAKKYRKPKKTQGQSCKSPQTKVNQIDKTAKERDDEESVNYIISYQHLYDQVYDSNYDSDSDDYVAAISCDSANQLEPLNAKIQLGKIQANIMIDSGSVVILITKTLANRILRTTPSAKWITTKQNRVLKTSSNESIKVLGQLATMVIYNNRTCKEAHLTVVEDGHKIIIGRDLFTSLGLAIVQQQPESDEDKIPGRSYLTEEQWADTALCSDTEIEKVICAASSRATRNSKKNEGW